MDRAKMINEGKADHEYYNKIETMVLFGSLVNSEKERVHDADLLVVHEDDRKQMIRFHYEHPELVIGNFIDNLAAEFFLKQRFIRGRNTILSLHTPFLEEKEIISIATADKHLVLMEHGMEVPGVREKVTKLENVGD